MLFLDLALVGFVVCREILVDDNGARRAWEVLPGEEGFNVEGGQLVVPSRGAARFLLPLRSHCGRRDEWRQR